MHLFKIYFLLFLIYSFIGWIIEIFWTFICEKKIVDRGFFIGPYCPIYGFGCLLLVIFLDCYKENLVVLFFSSIIICSLLEYFTSFFMEKLFNARWWDYSNFKFNLNGRICAETMIPFGVLGVLVVHYINPFLLNIVHVNNMVVIIAFALFFLDVCVSFGIISNMKNTISKVASDNTEEITRRVKEILFNKSFLHKRLIKAFPSFKSSISRFLRNH